MLDLLKKLTALDGVSGDETAVSDYIISQIDGYCDWKRDNLGNIIAFKKGENRPLKKVMVDAHTDEVGLIITSYTSDGFLKFKTVGGIDTAALMFRRVKIAGKINGVISGKPVHLLLGDERKKLPDVDSLYIDIGASSEEEAKAAVCLGDRAVVCGEFESIGENFVSKALDDRAGCAILIDLIKNYGKYDFYASFSTQEEVGLRGARTAAFGIDPECAIVLEGTTAADIAGVPFENRVCAVTEGAVVSFMDGGTVYDRELYNAALNSGVKCQPKAAATGGNNAGAIHLSREGVKTVSISLPCRYIHSSSSVANSDDLENCKALAKYMLDRLCGGEIG